jgi:diaminopropionate ammonia-lyase
VIAETWRQLGTARPRVVVVEPALAACLTTSARAGRPTPVAIRRESLMAGLSCGEVSVPAWPIVHAGASAFVTLEDAQIPAAMRRLARRRAGAIVAGESGAAGIAMLLAVCQDDDARRRLGLASDAHPVVIGTEGATDPAIYRDLTGT